MHSSKYCWHISCTKTFVKLNFNRKLAITFCETSEKHRRRHICQFGYLLTYRWVKDGVSIKKALGDSSVLISIWWPWDYIRIRFVVIHRNTWDVREKKVNITVLINQHVISLNWIDPFCCITTWYVDLRTHICQMIW